MYTAPNYYQGTFTGMISDFGSWLDSNFLTVVELSSANHSSATYNQWTSTIMGNTVIHAGNIGSYTAGNANTVGGYSPIVAYSGNDIRGKVLVGGSTGNISTQNPESYSGEVRLGAAWSRGGVYASGTLSLSTSSSEIHFVFGDTVPTYVNSSGAITFNNYNTGGIRVNASGTSSSK